MSVFLNKSEFSVGYEKNKKWKNNGGNLGCTFYTNCD